MFKLVRYFSITSLIAIAVVAVLLGIVYRQLAISNMIAVRESGNVEVTQLFINTVWEDFSDFYLNIAPTLTDDDLVEHPTTAAFRNTVLEEMEGLQTVKVKVFGLDGRTLFSTEAVQIGEDKADNAGFQSAKDGVTVSDLSYRDQFSAFEGVIEDRNMISSYVPLIGDTRSGEIQGVFEVYEDVTPLLQRINQTQYQLIGAVIVSLAGLYVTLLLIVTRAERIMHTQQRERNDALEALRNSEERLRDLIQNAPIILWTIQPNSTITTMEGRQLKQRQIETSDFIGQPITNIDPTLEDNIKRALNGQDNKKRIMLNGAIFDTVFARLHEDNQNHEMVIAVSTDITDLVAAEGALDATQKDLQSRNQQLERAMEFTRNTLESIQEAVQRGATSSELRVYIGEADTQLKQLN